MAREIDAGKSHDRINPRTQIPETRLTACGFFFFFFFSTSDVAILDGRITRERARIRAY